MNSPQTIINKGDNAHGHYTLFIKLHQLPTQNYWSVIEFYLQIHPTKAVGF